MRVISIICILLFGLNQCCIKKVNVVGEFSSGLSPYNIIFFPDSTFLFTQNGELNYKYSKGIWKLGKNRTIILNSFKQDKYIETIFEKSIDKLKDSVSIHIDIINMKEDYRPYYKLIVINDNNHILNLFCDKLDFNLPKSKTKNIYFKITSDARMPGRMFDTLLTRPLFSIENNINKVNITINFNDSLFNYQIFSNEQVKLKMNKVKIKNHWLTITPLRTSLLNKKGAVVGSVKR